MTNDNGFGDAGGFAVYGDSDRAGFADTVIILLVWLLLHSSKNRLC